MLHILFGIIAAYLIGSVPTSYLVGRAKGVDVRREGSGNVGATNVLRVIGKAPALITLAVDIAKGVISVTLLASLFYTPDAPLDFSVFRAVLGLSAVVGHNWPIFLKFKGGKGVATSCGALGILLPMPMAIAGLVFIISLLFTRYVSLSSILLSVTVPITAAVSGAGVESVILAVTLCILISYRHKSNIKRLLMGTEHKVGAQ